MVTPHLALDLGVRTESQQVSENFRVAPRAGVAWNVFPGAGTVIRAGFGLFYDRLPFETSTRSTNTRAGRLPCSTSIARSPPDRFSIKTAWEQ
jgi:hypothetical protein